MPHSLLRYASKIVMLLCIPAASFAAPASTPDPSPNLVQNPGFEIAKPGATLPDGWDIEGRGIYRLDPDAHSGKTSLKWVNSDPSNLVRAQQWLPPPTHPGTRYDFGVWVKTQDLVKVTNSGNGASLQLQWWDETKTHLLGWHTGLPEVKGTTGWTWLGLKGVTVPPEGKSLRIVCFVFYGMVGTAWFDDVEVRQEVDPLLDSMLTLPVYRGWVWTMEPSPIRVTARLNPEPYGVSLDRLWLRLDLRRNGETKVSQSTTMRPHQNRVDLTLPPRTLPVGEYTVTVTLNGAGQPQSQSFPLHCWPQSFQPKVRIDNSRRTLVNGQPFFPLGMYTGGMDEATITRYADSPFNTLMIYGHPGKEMTDRADRHGIKVIYSLNSIFAGGPSAPAGVTTSEQEEAAFRSLIKEHRNDPNLLAWYLNDELPVFYLDRLKTHQQWAEQEDPDHPTWTVLAQPYEVRQYLQTFDIIGADPYPVPFDPASRAGAWTHETFSQVDGGRPIWMVPQAMNWAHYYTDERQGQARAPTLEELRSMSWQCICEGATGLIYYTWEEMDKNPGMWENLKKVAGEIHDLTPVLLSMDPAPSVTTTPLPWLHVTTRHYQGHLYIIAVNDGDGEGNVTFTLPLDATAATVRGENRGMAVAGRSFTDRFEKLAVHVYEVAAPDLPRRGN